MFISVQESQTEGHVCNLGHDSTKMGYELKVIMPIYLHKCSAEKARVLYGSQRQYDLRLCENPCFKWNVATGVRTRVTFCAVHRGIKCRQVTTENS